MYKKCKPWTSTAFFLSNLELRHLASSRPFVLTTVCISFCMLCIITYVSSTICTLVGRCSLSLGILLSKNFELQFNFAASFFALNFRPPSDYTYLEQPLLNLVTKFDVRLTQLTSRCSQFHLTQFQYYVGT